MFTSKLPHNPLGKQVSLHMFTTKLPQLFGQTDLHMLTFKLPQSTGQVDRFAYSYFQTTTVHWASR